MPASKADTPLPGESFADMYHRHKEAGTCYLCQRPVQAGEARHGISGSHWDCHCKADRQFANNLASIDKSFDRAFKALDALKGKL